MIYIPIWSYFYKTFNVNENWLLTFTFQYGATSTTESLEYIKRKKNLHSNMELLLQLFIIKQNSFNQNLHSNMELLLRECIVDLTSDLSDLHSNMELLLPSLLILPFKYISIYIPIWSYFYLYV